MTFASVRCHEEVSQAGRKRAISTYDVSLCVCVHVFGRPFNSKGAAQGPGRVTDPKLGGKLYASP
jgi:hypothetical protein